MQRIWQLFLKCAMPMYLVGTIGLAVAGIILTKPFSVNLTPPPHEIMGTTLLGLAAVMALAIGEVDLRVTMLQMSPEERRIAKNLMPFLNRIFDQGF